MTTIILEREYELNGVTKLPGTEITFSDRSENLKEIIEEGYGMPKLTLPKDMPARKKLIEAGYDSMQSLLDVGDWKNVKGIGEKTAKKLNDYFINKQERDNG